MTGPPIRVLVVDDSAFTRKVIREVLEATPGLAVVGVARDGLEALEKIDQLAPDVVTLDLVMPNLDGLGVLRALPADRRPNVVVVSMSGADSVLVAEAFELGAVDVVRKPTALATQQLLEISGELVQKVRAAATARRTPDAPRRPRPVALPAGVAPSRRVVVIGTSTGGPQALTRLLTALPGDFPAPLLIALHIPPGYTDALARRLDEACAIRVEEARDGAPLRPGVALLAPGGAHLTIVPRGDHAAARVDERPRASPYAPSVDALFDSAVSAFGSRVLAVVLTGMGDDGLRGARTVRSAGGIVLAEAEASCVVYGMPRCVIEERLTDAIAPLEDLPAALVRHVLR